MKIPMAAAYIRCKATSPYVRSTSGMRRIFVFPLQELLVPCVMLKTHRDAK